MTSVSDYFILMTSVLLCIWDKFSVVQARSVGVVSKDSVTAWLLVPRTGPTQAWMKKSEPGQVFAVVKADSKNRATHTNNLSVSKFYKTRFSKYYQNLHSPVQN